MRYLLILLCLCGCTSREVAKSAIQAEQAFKAISSVTKEDNTRKLADAGSVAMAPVVDYLSDGERIGVDTTPESAIEDPNGFALKAAIQSGKAQQEVATIRAWKQAAGDWTSLLAAGLAGSGGLGLVAAKILTTINRYKNGLKDAIHYGKAVQEAETDDDVQKIKEEHAKRQELNGTKQVIDKAIIEVKNVKKPS
jgi:hypothetical protein